MTDPLVELVVHEPEDRVEALIYALANGEITPESTDAKLKYVLRHGPQSLKRMMAVLRHWRDQNGSGALLAASLRGLLDVRRQVEAKGPSCELVWSGEEAGGQGVRSTSPVVREMLDHARRSVLIVSYSVWLGDGPALDVVEHLAKLSSHGVDVTFILDRRYQDGWSVAQLHEKWPAGRRRPEIWSWQHLDDHIAKLHAKVIVVDRDDVLITSANLTGHGLEKNLELGLRVLGQPAADTADHFDRLLHKGVFERVPWP